MKTPRPPFPEPAMQPWEKQYQSDGETVLTASCTLPRFSFPSPAARRVDRFYRHMERCFQRRAAALSRSAAQTRDAARAASRWFTPWACALSAETERDRDVLTVRWTLEEQPGAAISGMERWNTADGFLLP